jgi:hypothetical protein
MSAAINVGIAPNWNWARPMWNSPPTDTRPVNPGTGPIVVSATGLGSGGGVGLGANSDSAWGIINVFVGLGAATTGTIILQWPVTPPTLQFTAAFATLAVIGANPYTITWTAPAPMLPNSKPHALAYQWANAT